MLLAAIDFVAVAFVVNPVGIANSLSVVSWQ